MMEALDYLEDEPISVDLKVQNPKCEPEMYVSYEIMIQTNSPSFSKVKSAIRRRYSEFVILHKLLSKEFPAFKTPSLPPRFPFKDHFGAVFVENRRKALEEFLQKLMSNKIYLSSKALHLFLQSCLSMSEIKDITRGKIVNGAPPKTELLNDRTYNHLVPSISSNESADIVNSNIHNVVEDYERQTFVAASDNSALTESPIICSATQANSKKVSFCNQVTVAQIHLD